MVNQIKLYSISEILGRNFFIPSYQRGYRWTDQQVTDLLEDIASFASKKDKTDKEFYCLQPVVVRKCTPETIQLNNLESPLDNNIWYEVIDGQQRLTTIKILLSYLIKHQLSGESLKSEFGKEEFILDYESREGTKEYLDSINAENSTNYIDFDFIYQALDTITKWFSAQTGQRTVRENIFRTFVHDMEHKQQEGVVQVIWYELEDESNAIDTFIRINMGKIPLTNAELIKALFLQKRNFGDQETAELRQIEIANEWDKMEFALRNEDFWWFLNRKENNNTSRIELLFDLICALALKENPDLIKLIGTDKYATFRYFNNKFPNETTFQDIENEWNTIKDYFLAFEEWYDNIVWYHYIGFLIYSGASIQEIYELYKDVPKDKFNENLKATIKETLHGKIHCSRKLKANHDQIPADEVIVKANVFLKLDDKDEINHYDYHFELQYGNKDKDKIRELLLLYNLQCIVMQYENLNEYSNDEIFLKFPFKLFKKENWDIEHIDSYTTNQMDDEVTQVEWIKTAWVDLGSELNELQQDLINFIDRKVNHKSFVELRNMIIEMAKENSNDEKLKNCMGNLALLDAGTNRSYGNALFPSKRRIIIEKINEGKYIPICTQNVFFKFFDKKGTSRTQWTMEDIMNYQNHIAEVLDEFLTYKEN